MDIYNYKNKISYNPSSKYVDKNNNTLLNTLKEIQFQVDKYNSPSRYDSGYDYDLRGYWNKYGGFNNYSSNMHLTDEFKKPFRHPTFSNESVYYTGQPWAIDWDKEPYRTLGALGIL